jgi:hypothetical protein
MDIGNNSGAMVLGGLADGVRGFAGFDVHDDDVASVDMELTVPGKKSWRGRQSRRDLRPVSFLQGAADKGGRWTAEVAVGKRYVVGAMLLVRWIGMTCDRRNMGCKE